MPATHGPVRSEWHNAAIAESAPPSDAAGGGHRAAKRALEIIEHVAAASDSVSLSELARAIDLPKSSAHALVRTLDEEGYLSRDGRGGYSLGPRLLRLLGSLPNRFELPRVARPLMEELVEQVGETAILGVRQGDAVVYVEQVEASHYIRYVAPLGEPRPIHATSIGKVHLAFMASDEEKRLLKGRTLQGFTAETLTGVRALRAELDLIRQQGFALNRQESMVGVGAVAAPIFDSGGHVIAGLSVAGPAERMDRPELPQIVVEVAANISAASVKSR